MVVSSQMGARLYEHIGGRINIGGGQFLPVYKSTTSAGTGFASTRITWKL